MHASTSARKSDGFFVQKQFTGVFVTGVFLAALTDADPDADPDVDPDADPDVDPDVDTDTDPDAEPKKNKNVLR